MKGFEKQLRPSDSGDSEMTVGSQGWISEPSRSKWMGSCLYHSLTPTMLHSKDSLASNCSFYLAGEGGCFWILRPVKLPSLSPRGPKQPHGQGLIFCYAHTHSILPVSWWSCFRDTARNGKGHCYQARAWSLNLWAPAARASQLSLDHTVKSSVVLCCSQPDRLLWL